MTSSTATPPLSPEQQEVIACTESISRCIAALIAEGAEPTSTFTFTKRRRS
jgi:hypothetical protein